MDPLKDNVLGALRRAPQGMKTSELATALGLDNKTRHRLRRVLDELAEAGQVERGPGGRYQVEGAVAAPAPPAKAKTGGITGMIRVHPAGYGFVERDDGEPDVFVPARFRGHALDGDKVRVATWMGYKGVEGRVEEVVTRGRAKLTGQVRLLGRTLVLEPDDPRIASTYGHVMLEEGAGGARAGQSVVAEITRYPTGVDSGRGELHARVTHVLGSPDDPRTEVVKIITCADIPDQFPDDTLDAARRTPQELQAADFADRIDLRDRAFTTIDPETARDFDDAVCLEDRPGGGLRLWVAVADVSHYVRPGTAIDREARIRGTSVYLPDRAIPMLPHELSAEMCSLKPEVDRCAMVVRLDLDDSGVVKEKAFCAAVIRSQARLDYPGVAAALAGDFRGERARYRQWSEALQRMHALSRKMRARRLLRGSLDFDLPEAVVVLDEDNPLLVRDVRRSKSTKEVKEAYQLVEEFMLAANEAVGEFFQERKLDTVWRVHDAPSLDRLREFAEIAQGFGMYLDPEEARSPKALQGVLKGIAGRPYERSLSFLLLRSLKQATYDIVNIGHFGLASASYLHFTSPIRRYPDLIVHRLLKVHLRREGLASGGAHHPDPPPKDALQQMAAESSSQERRAAQAEREVKDMYRAFLMRDRVGEELDGLVSGVTNFGVFVEIGEPFVEGMIKLDQLGDEPYGFDERGMRVVGKKTGRAFSLGDPVRVRVLNVSVARRRIDFALVAGGALPTAEEQRTAAHAHAPAHKPKPKAGGAKPQWGGSERGTRRVQKGKEQERRRRTDDRDDGGKRRGGKRKR